MVTIKFWIKNLVLLCVAIQIEGQIIDIDLEIKLISFLKDNGYKQITFANYPNDGAMKMMSTSFDYGLQSRFFPNLIDTKLKPLDFLVINLENLEQSGTIHKQRFFKVE